jgi:hypothetical protein
MSGPDKPPPTPSLESLKSQRSYTGLNPDSAHFQFGENCFAAYLGLVMSYRALENTEKIRCDSACFERGGPMYYYYYYYYY